ncbi:uncharacterized protein LOC120291650 [Eucalyptus grandis]|uniref:uncharacterized protein LOC120291650 n=1 Tax=Eucalyptus grandis TaxID=71139 RepID=UPI00192E8C4E|nr:uncharacterized protein LOC120291650 [Eucalyptus grandis]
MVNVQLMNHGVLDEGMRMMKENVQGFFDLPHHEKQKSAQNPKSRRLRAFVTSHDRKLQWNDAIFLKCHPAHARNLDLWPKIPPEFRSFGFHPFRLCHQGQPPGHGSTCLGGIVVNLGQIMEVYSNATYRAPDHDAGEQREGEGVHSNLLLSQPVCLAGPSPSSSQPPDSPYLPKPSRTRENSYKGLSHKLDDAVPFIDTLKL